MKEILDWMTFPASLAALAWAFFVCTNGLRQLNKINAPRWVKVTYYFTKYIAMCLGLFWALNLFLEPYIANLITTFIVVVNIVNDDNKEEHELFREKGILEQITDAIKKRYYH